MSVASPMVDVVIIGGGPAGLATGLALSRARHTCLIFDSQQYRNHLSKYMHTLPTWDHQSPAEYRAKARSELATNYETVRFVDLAVSRAFKLPDGRFQVEDASGSQWTGRAMVIATGVQDVFPDIPGYEECWVSGIFHCLFCHGYEERGVDSAGILAVDDLALAPPHTISMARNALQFTKRVTVYTNGSEEVASTLLPLIGSKSIQIDTRKVSKLQKGQRGADVTISLDDGLQLTHGFMVHKPKNQLALDFAVELGLEVAPSGAELKVTPPFNETSVPGCFAVGDLASPVKVVTSGVSGGVLTAAGLAMKLQAE